MKPGDTVQIDAPHDLNHEKVGTLISVTEYSANVEIDGVGMMFGINCVCPVVKH